MESAKTRRESEIWKVCDDLWAMGGPEASLTGEAIRERLHQLGYKKGSPNEIYKYRKTWQQSRGTTLNSGEEEQGDEDPISRAVELVREKLKVQSDSEVYAVRLEKEAQIELLVKKCSVLEEECIAQKQALENILASLNEQKSLGEQLAENLKEAHHAKSKAQVRLETLEDAWTAWKLAASAQMQEQHKVHMQELSVKDVRISHLEKQLKEEGVRHMDAMHALQLTARDLDGQLKRALFNCDKIQGELKESAERLKEAKAHRQVAEHARLEQIVRRELLQFQKELGKIKKQTKRTKRK